VRTTPGGEEEQAWECERIVFALWVMITAAEAMSEAMNNREKKKFEKGMIGCLA